MADSEGQAVPGKLRVPQRDGALLIEPPMARAAQLVTANPKALLEPGSDLDLQGRTLAQLRQTARSELIASAFRYTSEFRDDIVLPSPESSIIATGHQPDLFHPGVWAKNFVADRLARPAGGIGVNLVVDNDLCESAQLKVPQQTESGRVRFGRVEIESRQPPQPWEERTPKDLAALAKLPARVSSALQDWGLPTPLLSELEFEVEPDRTLADILTRVRSRAERSRGVANLELPISRMCHTESFLRFVCHMLVHIERFQQVHNDAIRDYRERNKLKSKTHPVPELTRKDEWFETPFWSWRAKERNRNRLFARQLSDTVLAISDGHRTIAELPLGPDMDACCAVEVLMQLASAGERIRTRALTTTIFARMLFADLFIHGIGGAKYDEMTDVILSDFYGVTPPKFMTVSATLRLLGDRAANVTQDDIRKLEDQLRDLQFNAQTALSESTDPTIQSAIEEKLRLIAEQNSDAAGGRDRYFRFRELNRTLRRATCEQQTLVENQITALQRELADNAVLNSREFSFALFPSARLDALFSDLD